MKNIKIIDRGKKGDPIIKQFNDEKEAEEFIEDHERPYDLDCEFSENYINQKLGANSKVYK
jgi:hypothetical protein